MYTFSATFAIIRRFEGGGRTNSRIYLFGNPYYLWQLCVLNNNSVII
jgi:hypothetical protein